MPTIAIGVSPTPGKDSYTASVPLSALEVDGTPPEEGDKVTFSVDATVKGVEGGTAQIEIDSINGEPVSQAAGEEESESPEEEEGEEQGAGGPPAGAGGGPSGPRSGADGVPLSGLNVGAGGPGMRGAAPGAASAVGRLGPMRKRNAQLKAALLKGAGRNPMGF